MKRLQFDFSDERVKELDDLVERTGLKTRAQFFNSALSLFEWAIREREAGRIIASVDEATDKYKEVEMPGFPTFKKEIDIISAALESLFALSEEAYQGVISNLIFQKRQKGDSRDRLERMQLLDSQRDSWNSLASGDLDEDESVSLREAEKRFHNPESAPRGASKSKK